MAVISDLNTTVTYRSRGRFVIHVLQALGIDYARGRNFWLRNQDRLHWIHADFVKRARAMKARLHPEARGGDAQAFRDFTADEAMVLDQFRRRAGIGAESCVAREEQKQHARAREKARQRSYDAGYYLRRKQLKEAA